jgi:hypothetical protein
VGGIWEASSATVVSRLWWNAPMPQWPGVQVGQAGRAGLCGGAAVSGRARLLELFPVVSVMGNLTLVAAVLSYAGQRNLTAVADRDGCRMWKCSAKVCAAPSTISPDRCLCMPPEQDTSNQLQAG